MLCFHQQVTAE